MKTPIPKYSIGQEVIYFSPTSSNSESPQLIIRAKICSIEFFLCSDGYSIEYALTNGRTYDEEFLHSTSYTK